MSIKFPNNLIRKMRSDSCYLIFTAYVFTPIEASQWNPVILTKYFAIKGID